MIALLQNRNDEDGRQSRHATRNWQFVYPRVLAAYGCHHSKFVRTQRVPRAPRGGTLGTPLRFSAHLQRCLPLSVLRLKLRMRMRVHPVVSCPQFILVYRTGVRVAVHTANCIPRDWAVKSQGVWVQDFPLKQDPAAPASQFEDDLIRYLEGARDGRSRLCLCVGIGTAC